MKKLILLFIALTFSGCGAKGISEQGLNTIVNGVGKAGDQIVDASIAKEAIVHKTQQVRLEQYMKAYKLSGLKVSFSVKDVEGLKVILPSIEYKPEPKIVDVALHPSEHPVWKFANNFGLGLLKWGFGGYAAHEAAGVLRAGYDAAGNNYYGDYVTRRDDYSGQDQSVFSDDNSTFTDDNSVVDDHSTVDNSSVVNTDDHSKIDDHSDNSSIEQRPVNTDNSVRRIK